MKLRSSSNEGTVTFLSTESPCRAVRLNTRGGGGVDLLKLRSSSNEGTVTLLSTESPCRAVRLKTKGGGGPSEVAVLFFFTTELVVVVEFDPPGVNEGGSVTSPLAPVSPCDLTNLHKIYLSDDAIT